MRKSISSMYFSTTAALLIVSTAVLCAIQMYLVMGYFKQDKKESLSEVASIVTTQIHLRQQTENSMDIDPALAQKIQESLALVSETSSTIILFTDENGVVQLCSEGTSSSNVGRQVPANILADLTADGSFFETGTLGGIYPSACYTVGGIVDDGGLPLGYVFASTSAGSLNIFVGDMFSSFVLAAGLMLLASSVLAIFFTTRLTTPLRRISEAARKFGGGDFSVRVPVDGDDEVAQLAVTFNNMARNLETIDSSRASFMGNIAHELRTPMTSIKGFIDGMLDGTIPDDMRQHYLGLVSQEVGRLTRLIQNMLDISKLEAGEYRVNAQSYDVWESLTGVVFSAEQRVEDQGVEIQGLAPQKTMVYADPDLVYQVVYNLFDNALKFTPKGGYIRFAVQKAGGFVTVSVENSGQGISAEALPFVFERFYKEDKSRGLNTKGSGLGLHICKVLIGLSGGKIWAESEEGRLCRFSFTLPCDAPAAEKRKNHK
ncbi:MAG TPA: HAMP domain-containing histidine kinase [Candidatus Fournierella merdipullorum]|uniref:histidine kinase n=1 Tax=Candidatus Allofournierella merdipullorum TaxID=2838595 RepID=A0A9D2E6P3_9FIRM|nr:HAMP domain-containing histidine kinase [Candidatus Fournierella merdipullorum]